MTITTPVQQPPPPKTPPPPQASSGSSGSVMTSSGAVSAAAVPNTGGGIDHHGPWTGGSREPGQENKSRRTPMCYRTAKQSAQTYKEVREGVDKAFILNSNKDHYSSQEKMWKDMMDYGLDSVFYAKHPVTNTWVELFHMPDALSIEQVRQHENDLRGLCSYAAENLTWARTFVEKSISKNIYNEIQINVKASDGGCAYWKTLMGTLRGEATSKLMSYQRIITDTKLVDVKGYNVRDFHQTILPPLLAAQQNSALPLNVGPIVMKNHLGPKSMAFQALVSSYAAEQAKESNQEQQFTMLLPQLRSLNQTYCNEAETWADEHKNVTGYVGEALTQDKKNKGNSGGRTCFECGSAEHLIKNCPKRKAKGGTNDSSENKNKKSYKWLYENKEGKTTITKDNKTYNWCKSCGKKGKWVSTHKPSECRNKKEKDSEGEGEGTVVAADVVMELVEGAFFAAAL